MRKILINKKGAYMASGNEKSDLLQSLRTEIEKLNAPYPSNFNILCTNINT